MNKYLYKQSLKTMMWLSYKIPVFRGRVGHSLYPFMFQPSQLMAIAENAKKAYERNPNGIFLEIGCAYGATTIFLKKLLPQARYVVIDTFSGFTSESLNVEVSRGKSLNSLRHDFKVNSKEWYEANLKFQNINDVRVIQSDVTLVDFTSIDPIAFCLLDVDLYQPISVCLPIIVDKLLPGGITVVDDCQKNHVYDGAEQAYKEFCEKSSYPYQVIENKLGIITK
jgi:predicted O-methyltransferase YrrM